MDGISDQLRIYVMVSDIIDAAQPPYYFSADWLKCPLPFGIVIFPLEIYRKMEALQHGRSDC